MTFFCLKVNLSYSSEIIPKRSFYLLLNHISLLAVAYSYSRIQHVQGIGKKGCVGWTTTRKRVTSARGRDIHIYVYVQSLWCMYVYSKYFFLFVPGFCADKFRRDKFYVRLFDCF